MVSIGIDLGTTNCCVAVCKGNEVEVIPYSYNSRTVPSYISFWKDEILYGDAAVKRLPNNIYNTIYDVKRLIGRQFSDPAVESRLDNWDFRVINRNGSVAVAVRHGDEMIYYTPQELSGLLLTELKKNAEVHLGKNVCNAVITVPTYFTDSQRQATIDAGRVAGFKEVKLLNEPTAAALAYNMKNMREEKRTVLVFDFGGGTFDVSLVECEGENVRVLAIGGNPDLGGNDIDEFLVGYMRAKYNLSLNQKQLFRLRKVCEEAKKQLSVSEEAVVELSDTTDEIILKRSVFNEICKYVFAETEAVVRKCLDGIRFDVDGVQEILMVGGSSKIRRIVTMLETHFNKPVVHTINPDEAVAIGAAIYASKWDSHSSFKGVNFTDICPYSLGVAVEDDTAPENGTDVLNEKNPNDGLLMSILINKNHPLPAQSTKIYTTVRDLQTAIDVQIYSGENNLVKNNKWLGHVIINGIRPAPAGDVDVEITYELDINGILNVSVVDPENGKSEHLKLVLDTGGYNEEELKTTIDVIQKRYSESQKIKRFKQRKSHLADLCNDERAKAKHRNQCDKAKARLGTLEFNVENSKWLENMISELEKKMKEVL